MMKTNIFKYKKLLFSLALVLTFLGCGEMLDNPLKDKETGEDINLLIVDFNIFTTRMTYKLIDVTSSEQITEEARVWFTGTNGNDVVTFAGEKEPEHITSQGQLELTVDPYVDFSANSPLDFTVNVKVDGYQTYAQNIQINLEGKKTFELYLSPTSGGDSEVINGEEDGDSFVFSVFDATKSAKVEKDYEVNYTITKADLINFKDTNEQILFNNIDELDSAYQNNPDNFLQLRFDIKTGFPATTEKVMQDGQALVSLLQKLEIGDFVSLTVDNRTVEDLNGGTITQTCTYTGTTPPYLFGFAKMTNEIWNVSPSPIEHDNLNISYTLARVSEGTICGTGCAINFNSNSVSSFSIDADIYDTDGRWIKTTNFKGTFPESIIIENVPNTAATIVFRNNNPAFEEIPSLSVDNLCEGTYNVDVNIKNGYVEYLIVLKAYCSGEPTVALAPTYSAEIRIKNSDDSWQGIDMEGGVVDILAKENEEYAIRFLWKDNWENDEFITEFDEEGNYVNPSSSTVTSEYIDDGRIKITIGHIFEQNVCDDLNW